MDIIKLSLPTGHIRVKARARAFSDQNVREHCFDVAPDGKVTVFDPVAKHYTTCHVLSDRSQSRIRRMAVHS